MSIQARIVAWVVLVVLLIAGWWRLTAHYESIGYERRKVEDTAAMQAQEDRNRDLQRAAEKKYTVATEAREQFIVTTVKEIRHATENLAACTLAPAAVLSLRHAAECASGDSAAACGPR